MQASKGTPQHTHLPGLTTHIPGSHLCLELRFYDCPETVRSAGRRIPNAVTYANVRVACCPVAFPCPAGTFLPSRSPHCVGLSCCASCHKESCPWKPEKQFSISSGQEFQLFHHVQCPMMFLGNVTQLVEYPLLLSHTVLYFVTLDFAGVSVCKLQDC